MVPHFRVSFVHYNTRSNWYCTWLPTSADKGCVLVSYSVHAVAGVLLSHTYYSCIYSVSEKLTSGLYNLHRGLGVVFFLDYWLLFSLMHKPLIVTEAIDTLTHRKLTEWSTDTCTLINPHVAEHIIIIYYNIITTNFFHPADSQKA